MHVVTYRRNVFGFQVAKKPFPNFTYEEGKHFFFCCFGFGWLVCFAFLFGDFYLFIYLFVFRIYLLGVGKSYGTYSMWTQKY